MPPKTNDWFTEQLRKPTRARIEVPYRGSIQRELSRRELSEGWARLLMMLMGIVGVMVGLVWTINWVRHL